MGLDEQLISINSSTRNLLRRTSFLKPIVQHILFEQITKNLTPPKDLQEKAFNDFCVAKGLVDKNQLRDYLEKHFLNYDELISQLIIPIKKQYYSLQKFGTKAERHFLERKDSLDRVIYSLIRVRDPDIAYDIYLKLEGKESDFISLVQKFSEGPEKNNNGKIGPISLSSAHPLLRKLLENQKTGLVLEPILIENWWVVARLEERVDAVFDDAMKMRMACELFENWLQIESQKVVKSLVDNQDNSQRKIKL
tara:strand:- start:2390 stop:3142 length:753 start_codon:yes stop_codon:yes gene_type:complete